MMQQKALLQNQQLVQKKQITDIKQFSNQTIRDEDRVVRNRKRSKSPGDNPYI